MSNNIRDLNTYYQSPEWAAKRNERLRIDRFKCAICGFTRALEVHHINYERLYHEDVSRDLITLCKKCHNEIEKRKKSLNPIPKYIENHSVYLAGKIRCNGWRERIFPCRYEGRGLWNYSVDEFTNLSVHANDGLTITGPYFISCDHGCYHGEERHGVGAVDDVHSEHEWGGCCGNYFSRDDVFSICKKQIDRAEIVFAYIDCRDCYGTLGEIGYAHAVGKDIIIVFSDEDIRKEMWFIDKMQRDTGIASREWIDKQLISHFTEG